MAKLELLTDNFDAATRDATKWTQYGTDTTPSQSTGVLSFTTTTNSGYGGYSSVNQYDLTSSYAKIQLVSAGNQSLTSLELYPINLYNTGNTDSVSFLITNGTLYARKRLASVNSTVSSVAYSTTNHKWLRIREASGITYYETSANGLDWTVFISLANPITVTALTVEPSAGVYAAEASGTTVLYDNLNTSPAVSDIETTYEYRISRSDGTYLGKLGNVTSEFDYTNEINTAGASIEIEVGITGDTSDELVQPIQTEDLQNITTESDEVITTERTPDIAGNYNNNALIVNNRLVEVVEYSSYNPNGITVFTGYISRWRAVFGGEDNIVVTVLGYGVGLDNYVIVGASSTDQSQLTTDLSKGIG